MKEKRWKPKNGEMYWYVWNDGNSCWGNFTGVSDERRFKSGNCFKTEAEAVAAAKKVKALLLSLQQSCNNLATILQYKKLPEWCKVGEWCYYDCDDTESHYYVKITDRGEDGDYIKGICADGGEFYADYCFEFLKQARLRPYNAEEMKELVGKVVCTREGKTFLVLSYSDNTVFFGDFSHTPEDLILDIYKFPDGSPCGCLEHLENGEWVR